MREIHWLSFNDFRGMVEVVGRRPDSRKMRLAACACVRRARGLLDDPRFRSAIEQAEDFADHRASRRQIKSTRQLIAAGVEEARSQLVGDYSRLPDWVRDTFPAQDWWSVLAYDTPIGRAAG